MPQSPFRSRLPALLALGVFLFVASPSFGQDKADAKSIFAKVKDGAGLAKVKESLSGSSSGARFRLDGFALSADEKTIKVSGVMLVPGASDEDRANAAKLTHGKVIEAVQKVAGVEKFEEFDFDSAAGTGTVKEVRSDKLPHLLLQKAANKAGEKNPAADELKINDAKFDPAGHLVLVGVRGSKPETLKWLADAIPAVLAENASAIGPNGKPADAEGKSWVTTDKVEVFDKALGWTVSAAMIQKALIQKDTYALSRLRVDRVYFISSTDKVDDKNPAGVSWSYALSGIVLGTDPPDAKAISRVCEEVFAAGKWEALKSGDLEGLTKADFRLRDPAPRFQKSVATISSLDGVRLDEMSEFGPEGQFVLTGIQPGLDEKAIQELTAAVTRSINDLASGSDGNSLYKQLTAHGISIQKLKTVKVRDLHSELRKWVAERLDDVRLTRLYFNEEGRLTLICDTPPPGDTDRAKVETELKARLATFTIPAPAKPVPPQAPAKEPAPEKNVSLDEELSISTTQPAGAQEPIVKAGPDTFKASLTKFLQTMVTDPSKPKWADVLIERGYFNEANQYTVRGVVDSEAQKKELASYIDSLKSDPEWEAYFKAGTALTELEVIPMSELVLRVQRVTPAYPLFDGVKILGAKYVFIKDDKSGFAGGLNLVFTAHVVGKPELYECRVALAELISKHPSYSRRLAKSTNERFPRLRIEEVPMPAVAANEMIAHFTNGYGANFLARAEETAFLARIYYLARAKTWIDAGLLHEPDQASIWFLSAYLHFMIGDSELTKRDLYRMIGVEDPLSFNGGEQRRRRYAVAKDFQGIKRDAFEKLWLKSFEEIKDGARPMTMVPEK